VIENFYSIDLDKSDEIFIQEKINKGPIFISFFIKVNHIRNKCRIERILPSYNNSFYCKNMKMLKVGKQNLLNNYLRKFDPVPNATAWGVGILKLINLGYLFLLGYLLSVETHNCLGFDPQISELLFISNNTNKNPCPEPDRGEAEIIQNFKQQCKELFKLNKSHNKIILDLAKLINQTLVKASGRNSYRIQRFMQNFIHKRS
jgi:hypothetical protein